VARVTVPAARNSTMTRVSRSGKNSVSDTMFMERDCHRIGWLY
jgi:hypothetical protein